MQKNNNSTKITIIIPTYQRPHLLKKAIQSALNQTWKDLQVLVCDNASKDKTEQIVLELAKTDSRLHYVCHPKNIGMLANYAFGLRSVQTDFFSFLSDDDLLLPCFCQTAMEGFTQFSEIGFFAASSVSVSKESGVICAPLEMWKREGVYAPQEGLLEMIGKYPIPTTVMYRREIISKVQIDVENPLAWDCDFLIQLASLFPFAISKKLCGIFIHHSDSYSGNQSLVSYVQSIKRLILRVYGCSHIDDNTKRMIANKLEQSIYHNSYIKMVSDPAKRQFKNIRDVYRCFFLHFPQKKPIFRLGFFIALHYMYFFFSLIKKNRPSITPNWSGYEEYSQILD